MVNKIINCYKKDSQIGRLEFVFGLVLIAILSSILFWAYSSLVSIDIHQENYLIGKSCLELIIYVASMPIFAARLRDMEWPTYIVLLLIPMWLFSTRNLIIYMHLNNIESIKSPVIFYVEVTLGLGFLVVLASMLFLRTASNKRVELDAQKTRASHP